MVGKKYDFDLIVIGSGRAGRVAAITTAQEGKAVAIIESEEFGGDDLNAGGVGFSTLSAVAENYVRVADGDEWGVENGGVLRINHPRMQEYATRMMDEAREEELGVLSELGVELIAGKARFMNAHEVSVMAGGDETSEDETSGDETSDAEKVFSAKYILIATGAGLRDNKIEGVNEAGCIGLNGVVAMKRTPRTAFVVGAGATGCEIAQFLANIGTRVLIADIATRLLPREDEEVGQVLDKLFNDRRIAVLTQTRVTAVERDHISRRVTFVRNGTEHTVRVDEIIIATGEVPRIYDLNLEVAGVSLDKDGVACDKNGRTKQNNIFVAGGAKSGDNTSFRAEREGAIAGWTMMGAKKHDFEAPEIRTIRTELEIALIGVSEDTCTKEDRRVKKAVVALAGMPSSRGAIGAKEGFVKLITDRGAIIGATLMGENAGEAGNLVLAIMKNGAIGADKYLQIGAWSEAIDEALVKAMAK